jgi:site-specific DNA-methyltransferase (adenine-specific)
VDSRILQGDCTHLLTQLPPNSVDMTFLDPPFNQAKEYAHHDDNMPDADYWAWMTTVCLTIHTATTSGGCIYFMQREKNSEFVLRALRESGWTFHNLIIWKKLTSAVPSSVKYGKQYQIIVYATKGERARVFNKLRIAPPLPANYKYERKNGMFVTDVWDDIRELTSGYFAGDEALRNPKGERAHKQQSPLALLLRMVLSSTMPGDTVLDPFAGTGTTLVVGQQLQRRGIGIEVDPTNVSMITERIHTIRKADRIQHFYDDYIHTPDLDVIWGNATEPKTTDVFDLPLFRTPTGD